MFLESEWIVSKPSRRESFLAGVLLLERKSFTWLRWRILKSLSNPSGLKYWSRTCSCLVCCQGLHTERLRAFIASFRGIGYESPTTWSSPQASQYGSETITALVFPKLMFNMGIQVTGLCLSSCERALRTLVLTVVFTAFRECEVLWLLALGSAQGIYLMMNSVLSKLDRMR